MKSRQSGFTLVEIAIVLVIIGLLLGGVLKGQEIIFNTKIKATFNQTRQLSAALNSYMDRYGQLPGDDTQAVTRFPGAAPALVNGNGNGVITYGNCASGAGTAEACEALQELRLSGFLTGSGSTSIYTPFGSQADLGPKGTFVTNGGNTAVLAYYPNSLTNKVASAIDSSFDDGNPASGNFVCQATAAYNMATPDNTIGQWCTNTVL